MFLKRAFLHAFLFCGFYVKWSGQVSERLAIAEQLCRPTTSSMFASFFHHWHLRPALATRAGRHVCGTLLIISFCTLAAGNIITLLLIKFVGSVGSCGEWNFGIASGNLMDHCCSALHVRQEVPPDKDLYQFKQEAKLALQVWHWVHNRPLVMLISIWKCSNFNKAS